MKAKDLLIDIMWEAGVKTQTELANKLGVTSQSVGSWFNDRTEPKLSTLYEIAEKLNVEILTTVVKKKV